MDQGDNAKSMTLSEESKTNIHGTTTRRLKLIYKSCSALLEAARDTILLRDASIQFAGLN